MRQEFERVCGACTVCCEIGAVPELGKGPHTPCVYQRSAPGGSCTIFGQPDRPATCLKFMCAWLRGLGTFGGRPDKVGAMFTVNDLPGEMRFGYCIETWPDAVLTTAREMAVAFARTVPFPVIVVSHGSDGTGDRVIVCDHQLKRSRQLAGAQLARLYHDVGLYHLLKTATAIVT